MPKIIACSDCGTLQQLPPSRRGHKLICCRCVATPERVRSNTLDRSLALALATLLMLLPANLLTFQCRLGQSPMLAHP
jgi:paraquat-inducible protein A